MVGNRYLLLFLMLSQLVNAETIPSEGIFVTRQVFATVGIIITLILLVITLIILGFFTSRFIQRKIVEPQYYIDETPITKDTNEEHHVDSEVIDLGSFEPNLSIKHMFASIKQCFIDLRNSLIPFNWSQAQQHIHQSSIPTNGKPNSMI